MKLQTHFVLYALLQLLKKGKIIQAMRLQPIGYHISDTHVILHCRGFEKIDLLNLPYDIAYYTHCHRNSGYHEKHWMSNIKVKREVHYMYVYSSKEELSIETTNENAYDFLMKQYEVVSMLDGRKIRYGEHSIAFSKMDSRGIGGSTKKRTFNNIVEYAKFEEKIELKSRNRK